MSHQAKVLAIFGTAILAFVGFGMAFWRAEGLSPSIESLLWYSLGVAGLLLAIGFALRRPVFRQLLSIGLILVLLPLGFFAIADNVQSRLTIMDSLGMATTPEEPDPAPDQLRPLPIPPDTDDSGSNPKDAAPKSSDDTPTDGSKPNGGGKDQSGQGQSGSGPNDQPQGQAPPSGSGAPPRNQPDAPRFQFDINDILTLQSEVTFSGQPVMLVHIPKIVANPEAYEKNDVIPPPAYLRRGVRSKFDKTLYFVESNHPFDGDVPKTSRQSNWNDGHYKDSMTQPDDAPDLPKIVRDSKFREQIDQEYFLYNFASDALFGMDAPLSITPITNHSRDFVAAFRTRSEVLFPDRRMDAIEDAVGAPPPPDAFTNFYTDVDVDSRYHTLAEQLTAGKNTRMEKSQAIADYLLGTDFHYTLKPGGTNQTDKLSYFLFQSKRGYCAYYAFAFVALARSIGIPSRVAVGYLALPTEESFGYYRISDFHAHAWGEVYLPKVGWVDIEVTNAHPLSEDDVPPDKDTTHRDPFQDMILDLLRRRFQDNAGLAGVDAFSWYVGGGSGWLLLGLLGFLVLIISTLKVLRVERVIGRVASISPATAETMVALSDLEDQGIVRSPGETLDDFATRVFATWQIDLRALVQLHHGQKFGFPEPHRKTKSLQARRPRGWLRRLIGVFDPRSIWRGAQRMSSARFNSRQRKIE